MSAFARRTTSILIFLLCWELVGRSQMLFQWLGWDQLASFFPRHTLFPPVSMVLEAAWEMTNATQRTGCCDLLNDLGVSTYRAVSGWLLGCAAGIFIGLLTGRLKSVDHYITPIIQLFRPLPPVAMIPVVILWFGIGELSKIFSIAFAVFFPVWINSHMGAKAIPSSYIWTAKSMHLSRWSILLRIVLPGSMTNIVAGIRNGIAIAYVMVFVSELAGASAGLGYEINTSYLAYRMDRMLAALAMLGALGWLSDRLLCLWLDRQFYWLRLQKNGN